MSSEEADEDVHFILPRVILPESRASAEGSQRSRSSGQVSSRASITPIAGSPTESPERIPPVPIPGRRVGQLRFPSISLKHSSESVQSEAVFSVSRKRDGDSSYVITPRDSDTSFASQSFSAEGDQVFKLKQRLSIPAKEIKGLSEEIGVPRALGKNEEYLRDFATFNVTFTDEEIQNAFKEVDHNRNGYLTVEEIRLALEGIGEYASTEELEEMVRMVDLEGRGEVAFEEFYKMATGQSTAPIGGALPPSPLMTIVGISDQPKTWGLQSRSRYADDKSNASKRTSDGKSAATAASKPRPLRTFATVSQPKRKPKVFNLSAIRKNVIEKPVQKSEESQPSVRDLSGPPDKPAASAPPSTRKSERSPLVSELLHSSIFKAETIEKLVELFKSVAGKEAGDMSYISFLVLVNSHLPSAMRLEDDRVTRRMFTLLDKDGSQGLNIREFVLGLSALCRPTNEEQFKFVYRVFDADGDGTISKNELIRVLKLNPITVQTDEQAQTKAEELLYLAGDNLNMTLEGFLKLGDKRLALLVPVQERARKMAYIVNSLETVLTS